MEGQYSLKGEGLWVFVQGKLNTCDLLQRKCPNVSLYPNWCGHLFFQWTNATAIWSNIFSYLVLVGVSPKRAMKPFFNLLVVFLLKDGPKLSGLTRLWLMLAKRSFLVPSCGIPLGSLHSQVFSLYTFL